MVVINDVRSIVLEAAVVLTQTLKLSICLSYTVTGQPFISTLELRMLKGSLYDTPYEAGFLLGLSARAIWKVTPTNNMHMLLVMPPSQPHF